MCSMIMYTTTFLVNKIMPRKEIQTWWTYFKAHIVFLFPPKTDQIQAEWDGLKSTYYFHKYESSLVSDCLNIPKNPWLIIMFSIETIAILGYASAPFLFYFLHKPRQVQLHIIYCSIVFAHTHMPVFIIFIIQSVPPQAHRRKSWASCHSPRCLSEDPGYETTILRRCWWVSSVGCWDLNVDRLGSFCFLEMCQTLGCPTKLAVFKRFPQLGNPEVWGDPTHLQFPECLPCAYHLSRLWSQ